MKRIVGLVVLSIGFASAAHADGANFSYSKRDWQGAYLGGHFGWLWTDVEVRDLDFYNGAGDFSYDVDDPFGGVQAGYNAQVGNIVFGVEGELGYLGIDESAQFPPYVGVRLPTDSRSSVDGGIYGTIAGRLGFSTNGFLVYGKGGWGFADVDVSYIDNDPTGTTLVSGTSADQSIDGPVYGGGVELALTDSASVKVEYLRFDFDEPITVSALSAGGGTFRFAHDIDAIDTVKVGINFQLGSDRVAAPLK